MERKRVLVVDDSTTMRQLQCLILRDVELELVEARDGGEALSLLEREPFDAVLLDVNMPEVDGRETHARLRKLPGCATLPVVFVTAEEDGQLPTDADTERIAKPLNAADLRATVRRVLDLPPQSTRGLV